jgi:ABC-type multidrug transport system fused ATPase/permease subunit
MMARCFLFLFGALELALMAVLGRVVDCAIYVDYDPCASSIAWTLLLPWLLLWPGLCGASMVWTLCLPRRAGI